MPRSITPEAFSADLDGHLSEVTRRRARRGLPAPQVLVRAPGVEYRFGDDATPFHAASVGKLATAALIMQEVEAGRLELEAPVETLLPAAELAGLLREPGATVEQLLGHTSGAADYFDDPVVDGPRFTRIVTGEPQRRWKPADLLDFSRERQRPFAAPGARFHYSDTGYVLLGRILEERNGASFGSQLRSRVFEPAGMTDSVLWLREPGPDAIAPAWLDGTEVSRFASLTCDWAGGGIVTTLEDLHRLIAALSDGTLIRSETWTAMTTMRHRFRPGMHYGLGTMELRFEGFMFLLRGLPRPVGHTGVLGVHGFIDPVSGARIALNFHSSREMPASVRTHIRIMQGLARLAGRGDR